MGRRAQYLPMRSINSTGFNNAFQALGDPIEDAAVIYKIVNDSGVNVTVSLDGATDHDIVPLNGFAVYDLRANKGDFSDYSLQAKTQFFVKGASASTGLVYLVVIKERNP